MSADLFGYDAPLAEEMATEAEIEALWEAIERIERPAGGFRAVLGDYPWAIVMRSERGYEKSAQRHYKCVPTQVLREIGANVARLMATDSMCFFWATSPMLVEQIDVLRRTGFKYAALWPWFKGSPRSEGEDPEDPRWKAAFGTGYIGRSCSEPMIIGTRGKPVILPSAKSERAAFFEPVRDHSRKPDSQYQKVERISPGPYLELFSRTTRCNWTHFGAEVGQWRSE